MLLTVIAATATVTAISAAAAAATAGYLRDVCMQVNEAMEHVASGKARYRVVLTSDWQPEEQQQQQQQQQAQQQQAQQ
jgi:hypothetical protein